MMTVEAIYERGVLRLKETLPLPEGTLVELIVIPRPSESARSQPSDAQPGPSDKTPAKILAEIAAMYSESSTEGSSGRDHDKILYGGEGGAR